MLKVANGKVVRGERSTNVSAYMLVYLRETEEERLLDRPAEE